VRCTARDSAPSASSATSSAIDHRDGSNRRAASHSSTRRCSPVFVRSLLRLMTHALLTLSLPWLRSQGARLQLQHDRLHRRGHVRTRPLCCPENGIQLRCPTLAANALVRGVRRDASRSKLTCKLPSPMTQRLLADIEPNARFTHRLHDDMHVRMWLVRVQHHRVPIFCPRILHEQSRGRRRVLSSVACQPAWRR
jgi:hypothetical protein